MLDFKKLIGTVLTILLGSTLLVRAEGVPPQTNSEISVEILEQNLSTQKPSRDAQNLRQAYDALENKKFTDAVRFASKLKMESNLIDYAFWIKAKSDRELAKNQITAKKLQPARSFIEKSISFFHEISNRSPYSPLIRSLSKEIGVSELVLAEVNLRSKKEPAAVKYFESAFQRLQLSSQLSLVPSDRFLDYAKICKKIPTTLCQSWVRSLSSTFSKNSEFSKILSEYLPESL